MDNSGVALFASCAGYGTYTPALALKKELACLGVNAQLFVFETFFSEEQKSQFLTYRSQFHDDIRFAAMATSIASKTLHDTKPVLTREQLPLEKFTRYVVLYGLWVPVLLQLGIDPGRIVCLQMDVGESPSWHAVTERSAACENIWMLGKDGSRPSYKFQDVASGAANHSLVIHGGGWGITSYAPILDHIKHGYELHVIHSSENECGSEHHSYYSPLHWLPDKENPEYPPLYRFAENTQVDFYELCSQSAAIISKPGGGTCADCLRLRKPLIYLRGMAKHEDVNARHFKELGYACSFEEWEDTGFSFEALERMREKIAGDMAEVALLSRHLI